MSIEFSNEDNTHLLRFYFKVGVLAYRNADESYRLATWAMLNRGYNPHLREDWSLYTSRKSQYINWFLEESRGAYSIDDFTHYIFSTPNDVIDVISTKEPLVELIPINN